MYVFYKMRLTLVSISTIPYGLQIVMTMYQGEVVRYSTDDARTSSFYTFRDFFYHFFEF